MTVSVALIVAKNNIGLDIYPAGKTHKFATAATSYPDSLFYSINFYSYNEVAIFEGEIKKVAGYPLLTDTATPMFSRVRIQKLS